MRGVNLKHEKNLPKPQHFGAVRGRNRSEKYKSSKKHIYDLYYVYIPNFNFPDQFGGVQGRNSFFFKTLISPLPIDLGD